MSISPRRTRPRGLRIPTAPPKPTDKRWFAGETVQCEAIAPDELLNILREAIKIRRSREVGLAALDMEAEMRAVLMATLSGTD